MTMSPRAQIALAALGAIAIASVLARPRKRDVTSDRASTARVVTIRADAADLQRDFADPVQLPRFFRAMTAAQSIDATHHRWTFGSGKHVVPIDIEIVDATPGRRFSWRTIGTAPFAGGGSLTTEAAPGNRGTEVRLALHVEGPGAKPLAAFARVFGAAPAQIAAESLRAFKALNETGERPTAESA